MTGFIKVAMAVIAGGIAADFLTHPSGTAQVGNSAVGLVKAGGTIITGGSA